MEKIGTKKVNVVKGSTSVDELQNSNTKLPTDDSIEKVEVTSKSASIKVKKDKKDGVSLSSKAGDKTKIVTNKDRTLKNTLNETSVDHKDIPGKKKKKKRQPVGKAGFIAICCTVVIVSAGIGMVGGYFLYNKLKPEEVYESTFNDIGSLREKALTNPNLIETFKGEEYNIINLALDKYQSHKHTFTLGYGEVDSMNGVQTVHSATIGGENVAFNQNISTTDDSALYPVFTAYRFYYDLKDKTNPVISAYEKKKPEEWTADMKQDNTYTADEFIAKYGKLNYGNYLVSSKDKFITLGEEGDGSLINGTSIYQFTDKSVQKCSAPKVLENGNYKIDVILNAKKACKYYAYQIKTNGELEKMPKFDETLLISFELNKDFELVESFVKETYSVNKIINTGCNSTMLTKYFYTDEETQVIEGKEIKVPEKGEKLPYEINQDGKLVATN